MSKHFAAATSMVAILLAKPWPTKSSFSCGVDPISYLRRQPTRRQNTFSARFFS